MWLIRGVTSKIQCNSVYSSVFVQKCSVNLSGEGIEGGDSAAQIFFSKCAKII